MRRSATIPFALIGAHTSILLLSLAMLVRGFGIGFAFMPAMTAAFAALERHELSDATPQLNVLQRVGGSIGIAVLAVVLSAAPDRRALRRRRRHRPTARRSGAAAGLTALAIIPCVILAAQPSAPPGAPRPRTAQVPDEALAEAAAA